MKNPKVGIIMGSASDIPVVEKGTPVLEELEIDYEVAIASAHRTPQDVEGYATKAKARGIEAIIAVAGLSAALPGVVASMTTLPVIGVPVKGGALDGLDALLSIAQMPPGVPAVSVGLNGMKNACLYAARILAVNDKELAEKLEAYARSAKDKVVNSREKLADLPAAPDSAF
jgi:5-(carboxyamino)imidazole ribonucleotide mutase